MVLPALSRDAELRALFRHVDRAGGTTAGLVVNPDHAFRAGVDVVDGGGDDVGRASNRLAGRLVDVDRRGLFFLVWIADDARGRASTQQRHQYGNKKQIEAVRFHGNLLVNVRDSLTFQ